MEELVGFGIRQAFQSGDILEQAKHHIREHEEGQKLSILAPDDGNQLVLLVFGQIAHVMPLPINHENTVPQVQGKDNASISARETGYLSKQLESHH